MVVCYCFFLIEMNLILLIRRRQLFIFEALEVGRISSLSYGAVVRSLLVVGGAAGRRAADRSVMSDE